MSAERRFGRWPSIPAHAVSSASRLMLNWQVERDYQARASYIYLPGHPRLECDLHTDAVARTEDIGHGLLLDIDVSGHIIGVEHIWGAS